MDIKVEVFQLKWIICQVGKIVKSTREPVADSSR